MTDDDQRATELWDHLRTVHRAEVATLSAALTLRFKEGVREGLRQAIARLRETRTAEGIVDLRDEIAALEQLTETYTQAEAVSDVLRSHLGTACDLGERLARRLEHLITCGSWQNHPCDCGYDDICAEARDVGWLAQEGDSHV